MNMDENKLKGDKAIDKLSEEDKQKFLAKPKKSISMVKAAAKLMHKMCQKCRSRVLTDICLKGDNKFDPDVLCKRCREKYDRVLNK